jgi:hypothetical protein
MKTITTTEFNRHLSDYLDLASKEAVFITLDDGRLLRLSGVNQDDLEDELLEADPRFATLIEARRADYARYGGLSLTQLKEQLSTSRLHEDLPDYQVPARDEATADKPDHAQED